MIFLIRFWRSLTKKDSVESAKYEFKNFLLVLQFLDVFFHGSGFFRIGCGFLADQDPDSGKKSLIQIRKKNPDPKH